MTAKLKFPKRLQHPNAPGLSSSWPGPAYQRVLCKLPRRTLYLFPIEFLHFHYKWKNSSASALKEPVAYIIVGASTMATALILAQLSQMCWQGRCNRVSLFTTLQQQITSLRSLARLNGVYSVIYAFGAYNVLQNLIIFSIFGLIFTVKDNSLETIFYVLVNLLYLAGTFALKLIGGIISSVYVYYIWIGVFGICIVVFSAIF